MTLEQTLRQARDALKQRIENMPVGDTWHIAQIAVMLIDAALAPPAQAPSIATA
jgi:hypothetical protein